MSFPYEKQFSSHFQNRSHHLSFWSKIHIPNKWYHLLGMWNRLRTPCNVCANSCHCFSSPSLKCHLPRLLYGDKRPNWMQLQQLSTSVVSPAPSVPSPLSICQSELYALRAACLPIPSAVPQDPNPFTLYAARSWLQHHLLLCSEVSLLGKSGGLRSLLYSLFACTSTPQYVMLDLREACAQHPISKQNPAPGNEEHMKSPYWESDHWSI